MPKEFKFDSSTGKTLYRNHRAESFQPYTKEMEEYDKFMSKTIVEEDTLFSKSNTTPVVEETPTTEGDIDMQECCKFYDNLVPFSCRHRGLDKWDLLWQCSVCGQWYKIEFMYNNLTPRIKNIQEVDFNIYFAAIRHDKLDTIQLRNLQGGVPIFDHIRNTAADFEVTRKYDWMCPNCTFNPETILGDEGSTYRCGDCGTTYKLWTNQDTKAVSYIKLNAPKVEAPVVVSTPPVEDTPVQEETIVEEVVEVNESPDKIVEDTVVEETTVNEATEEITPTIVDGKVMAPAVEWSEDIIDEMMDTGELPEAFTAPSAEDIPDEDNNKPVCPVCLIKNKITLDDGTLAYQCDACGTIYTRESVDVDKESDTSTIPEEGILIARGIPDWMCDSCLDDYTEVNLVDYDNAPGYKCNVCGVIHYVERVGEEQDIVFKQFKQITPEEMTALYVTDPAPVVSEEKDIFADKVVEALTAVGVEEHPPIIDDAGEDIDPKDFVSIDDEDTDDSLELGDVSVDAIHSVSSEEDVPDMTLSNINIDIEHTQQDNALYDSDEIMFDKDEMEHDYHTQAIREDMSDRAGVDTYHVHVNLPKGIENIVVSNEQLSKGPLGNMLSHQKKVDDFTLDVPKDKQIPSDLSASVDELDEMDDYKAFQALQKVTTDWDSLANQGSISTVVDKVEGFATVPNSAVSSYLEEKRKLSEVHTLDFVVMDNRKNKGVRINKNESYSFEVESFSACMDSAGSGIPDYPDDKTIVIKDELAGELGSWDSMIYELRLTTGELYCVCIDLAMLNKVTISYK